MNINFSIFKKVETANAQILVVTKYFDAHTTNKIFDQIRNQKSFLALGENRIEKIREKNIPRNFVHFIGKIQSRKIKEIVKYCIVIHSLENLKHAELLNEQIILSPRCGGRYPKRSEGQRGTEHKHVFLQINISREPQKSGILPEELPAFLNKIKKLNHLKILGLSAIGSGEFTPEEKRKELRELKNLRDQHLPGKKISAGTSRDYKMALKEGIEIVRVGHALFNE